ncbi:metallophosphoesterase family protein [Haloplanus halophilus]|uniref:metallophosphoesterase family protein n=1 Tax=Haloplanus halophilus TaxID=2949993 RepID=UPI002040D842|nr:metallophosphoesterase family protein [Haloplanus sp. GDY1]
MIDTAGLNAALGDAHHRVDADAWDGIYVVGDVHGCLAELEGLLDRLAPGADDLVVFVGDLVRKGPDSAGVVDLVRSRDNFLTVRGNNEEKLLRGEKDIGLDDDALVWIADRPVAISWDGALVVHAGVDPRKPLAQHTVDDFETVRELGDGDYEPPFWYDAYEGSERVFFGHTPLDAPVVRESAVGLDTGCVYGGELTAYDRGRDRFVSVAPDRTVRERPARKFVTPRSPVVH